MWVLLRDVRNGSEAVLQRVLDRRSGSRGRGNVRFWRGEAAPSAQGAWVFSRRTDDGGGPEISEAAAAGRSCATVIAPPLSTSQATGGRLAGRG